MLSRLHHDCLASILGPDLVVHELDRGPVAGALASARALRGHIDGISPQAERAVLARIAGEAVDRVFLNGSNLGRLARTIRRTHPGVRIFTFFHNVEAHFFLDAFRKRPRPRALAVLAANFAAERMAVRSSDRLIALSQRDSDGLKRLYGRAATDILPMAIEDQLDDRAGGGPAKAGTGYLLFVGGAFFANAAGISWFVDNVVPHIERETVIVGHGFEALRERLERGGKVRVIGGAERLQDWYAGAAAVIAPIFEGSGMKTKLAEALMFGKRILGTSEAFSGYEEVAGEAGWICNDRHAFIERIGMLAQEPPPLFDQRLRSLYERRYSRRAAERTLAEILE